MGLQERETKRKTAGVVASIVSDAPIAPKRGRPKKAVTQKSITLTLDQATYEQARKVAHMKHKSVSQLVNNYLKKLVDENPAAIATYDAVDDAEA